MRLRTVVGHSVSEALSRVQKELGPNALVLETRTRDGRAEVVAADVEREKPTEGLMRLRAEVALLRRELGERNNPAPESPPVQTRLALVEKRLSEQDLHPELTTRVLEMIARAPNSEGDPIDPGKSTYARNAVAGLLPGIPPSGAAKPRCFVFVGPPGAGKTTTIAKLAEQTPRSAHRSLGILTLDGERPGSTEILRACSERLKVPMRTLRGPEEVEAALDSMAGQSTILLDTAGFSFRDRAAINALRERLRRPHQVAVHLVLPANLESMALRATARALECMKPSAITFTKLDETGRFGNLINLPVAMELPVAALCNGRSISGHLQPATRALVADLILGRRDSSLEKVRR